METALLDLLGRALGVPVHTLLGGTYRDRTEAHGSVGWDEDTGKIVAVATQQAQTYRWLKLYAGRGELAADLDRLHAVRDAVGPDIKLFVDINTMWTPERPHPCPPSGQGDRPDHAGTASAPVGRRVPATPGR